MKRQRTLAGALIALAIAVSSPAAVAQPAANSPSVAAAQGFDRMVEGAGRVLIGQLFVISGAGKIGNFAGTAARMTAVGLPAAEALLVPVIALEVGAGLALALDWHADWATAALSAFVVVVSPLFHNFWAIPDAMEAMRQQQLFLRNLAVLGGLLTVYSHSDGR